MTTARLIAKMIDYYEGNTHDICHFLKVYAYASAIGRLENLPADVQATLEAAAVVHDIACPYCRRVHGNAAGHWQEQESEALLRPFLAEFDLPRGMEERVIFLVCHHHTTTAVDGADYQILLEADYLVNADEAGFTREHILKTRDELFKTESGRHMLESIFLGQ